MKNSYLLKKFIPYFKKYRHLVAFDLFCAALTMVCDLTLPMILRYLVNTGVNNIGLLSVGLVVKLGLVYFILKLVEIAASYYMAYVGHVVGARIETDMRRDVFEHLQTLSHSYFNNTKVGQVMARITTDLFDVTEFAHHCPEEFFIGALKFLIAFAILISINPILTLILFIIIPIMIYCSSRYNHRMRHAFKKQRNHIGDLNSGIESSLLGVREVKSFANEEVEKKKFDKDNHKFLDIKRESYRYMSLFLTITRSFDGIMYMVVIILGGIFMLNGVIQPGDLFVYTMYVSTMLVTIRRIVEFMEQFQKGMTGLERFVEIMDTKTDIYDIPNARELVNTNGNLEFCDVSFKYKDNGAEVLKNLSFKADKGMSVALVGPSGAGKTTICNLIPRFYDLESGEILIDGENIKNFTLKSLRSNIGVVSQDVYLFSGTVFDNIEYGRPGAGRKEVEEAARLAGAYDFIMSLADGFDTYVGERGIKLSGGQKQRISIARVFLKNPPILILDEATSALDTESEKLVQKSLSKLSKGRTTITIAHRLTTIQNSDKILVIDSKHILESGSHDELLARGGAYSKYYNMQFEGVE